MIYFPFFLIIFLKFIYCSFCEFCNSCHCMYCNLPDFVKTLLTIIGYFIYLFLIIGGLKLAFYLLRLSFKGKKKGSENEFTKNDSVSYTHLKEVIRKCNKHYERNMADVVRLQIKACLLQMQDAISLFECEKDCANDLLLNALNDYGKGLGRLYELSSQLPVAVRNDINPYCEKAKECYTQIMDVYIQLSIRERQCQENLEKEDSAKTTESNDEKGKIKDLVSKVIEEFNCANNGIIGILFPDTSLTKES